jgi:hypothetical protein
VPLAGAFFAFGDSSPEGQVSRMALGFRVFLAFGFGSACHPVDLAVRFVLFSGGHDHQNGRSSLVCGREVPMTTIMTLV